MKQEKMQLVLAASSTMDKWAEKNSEEHNKIRLSKRARLHYRPSDGNNARINIHGKNKEKNLNIGPATKADIRIKGISEAKEMGFVTTKTYQLLMGRGKKISNSIWVSEKSHNITLGCDPEFVVLEDNGTAFYGDTVLGYSWGDQEKKKAKFGSDGPCVELRPDPENNVGDLINNIRILLKDSANIKKVIDYRWVGGASYRHASMNRRFPIGGHIHFGLPNLPGAAQNTDYILQNRVARILEELIAIPLIRIDTPMAQERRTKFGKFQDIKNYDHRFEWRTPSGIWLVHPTLATVVLSAAKAVTEECWKRYEDNDCDKEFMLQTTSNRNLFKSFSCMDTEVARGLINESKMSSVTVELIRSLHKKLKSMSTYSRYKTEIDEFIKICGASKTPITTSKLFLKRGWLEDKPL